MTAARFKGLEFDLGMTGVYGIFQLMCIEFLFLFGLSVLHSHRDLVSILLPSTGACTREIE
jgi:hypothetical protein